MPVIMAFLFGIAFVGLALDLFLIIITFYYCCGKCHKYDCQRESYFLKILRYAGEVFMEYWCCCIQRKVPVRDKR